MIVGALDLATVTGWAWADSESYTLITTLGGRQNPPPQPASGFKRMGPTGCSLGDSLLEFHKWLEFEWPTEKFEPHCDLVVFETPFITSQTHQHTARKLMSMAGLVEMQAALGRFKVKEVYQQRWRKHFIGPVPKGRAAKKQAAIDACLARGWEVTSDNEADALGILDYAMHCL